MIEKEGQLREKLKFLSLNNQGMEKEKKKSCEKSYLNQS